MNNNQTLIGVQGCRPLEAKHLKPIFTFKRNNNRKIFCGFIFR